MANLLEDIQATISQLAAANANVFKYQTEFDKLSAEVSEYQRQSTYHASRQDYTNSAITDRLRDDKILEKTATKGLLDQAIITRDNLAKRLQDLQATLTPEQKAQVQTDANLAIEKAKENQLKLSQGTTKYLIWGAVALVIVIGAIIILRKKLAA